MAWLANRESEVVWSDGKGTVGGFTRDPGENFRTGVGPVHSPNGTVWYIVVDDTGAVKTAQP